MFDTRVVAGFPVPPDNDERSQDIDILRLLCPHPEASYLVRVQGESMIDAGICSGDIVIVDKSRRDPYHTQGKRMNTADETNKEQMEKII